MPRTTKRHRQAQDAHENALENARRVRSRILPPGEEIPPQEQGTNAVSSAAPFSVSLPAPLPVVPLSPQLPVLPDAPLPAAPIPAAPLHAASLPVARRP